MERLLRASPEEAWLATLHQDAPASAELHRDPDHGFMLLAHTEQAGLSRPPHDHGRSWVLYGIQSGEIEMGTYARVETDDGVIARGAWIPVQMPPAPSVLPWAQAVVERSPQEGIVLAAIQTDSFDDRDPTSTFVLYDGLGRITGWWDNPGVGVVESPRPGLIEVITVQ